MRDFHCAGAIAVGAAVALTGCAAPQPLTLSESFSNPDSAVNGTARPMKVSRSSPGCALIVKTLTDTRTDPTMFGSVAGRAVRGPADPNSWLRNVVSGLESRGITVNFDTNPTQEAEPLLADITLRIAWVSDLHTSKSATTLWHVRVQRGNKVFADRDIRGANTALNWASGDGEMQRLMDRALAHALDQMATDVHAGCSVPQT